MQGAPEGAGAVQYGGACIVQRLMPTTRPEYAGHTQDAARSNWFTLNSSEVGGSIKRPSTELTVG